MAPGRDPADFIDRVQCFLAETIDRSKPLFRSTVENRFLTTPAMRILMAHGSFGKEPAFFSQSFQNRHIGIEDEHALVIRNDLRVAATGVRRTHRFEAPSCIFLADVEVIFAVVRSRVDDTGTTFQGDVVAADDGELTIRVEGVLEDQAFELAAFMTSGNTS